VRETVATALVYTVVVDNLLDLVVWLTKRTRQARKTLKWNAEAAEDPPLSTHSKNKGWRRRSEKKSFTPWTVKKIYWRLLESYPFS